MSPQERYQRHIAFAEKVMTLLDEGSFTTTYKFAVLLALVDLCLEQTRSDGSAPTSLTTRQLAEKVTELYWSHASPYPAFSNPDLLRQLRAPPGRQAAILRVVCRFREDLIPDPSLPLARARLSSPKNFERTVREVEWKLIQMPLPRLQIFGKDEGRFIYEINWSEDVRQAEVRAYQCGTESDFDNTIRFKDQVSEHLVLLSPLLRPLIQQKWADMVSRLNGLPENALREFLFGSDRISLEPVRAGLVEIEEGRCFYCEERFRDSGNRAPVVDHFIPWARHPNNAIENLVPAHGRCNHRKRDFLAAARHVEKWTSRIRMHTGTAGQLRTLAGKRTWETDPDRILGVARAIYLRLRPDVPLWFLDRQFHPADRTVLQRVLG